LYVELTAASLLFYGLTSFKVQVIVAVIYCFFAAGTVFGFAAIKPVFIREGVYSGFCSGEEDVCYGQELQ
jgi:hypothetical protein